MKSKTIRQSVNFKADPNEIYEALIDSKKHSKFTGSKAVIINDVGGKFTAYDGWIQGINIELVPGKKIVQKWRGDDWTEGHYSIATFKMKKIDGGTRLEFTQTNVPEEHYKSIYDGWFEHYWEKMKKTFGW